jgi:catechol 2,3-dioxygenase-like lactoylglutathione lyase family enzyme
MNQPGAKVVQVALCTNDIARTVRRYIEVFGFGDGGGEVLWGRWLGELQGTDYDADVLEWWLITRQSLFQIELFHHSTPTQRPKSPSPVDLGWVRWGFAVPDFDDCLDRLGASGCETLAGPTEVAGVRRFSFIDPNTAVITEVLEEGPALPGGVRVRDFDLGPQVVYAAASVADLNGAREYFVDVLGLPQVAPDAIHPAGDDTLWGLHDTRCASFVVQAGDIFVEIVSYTDPVPAQPPSDHRVSDQGMMNIALGWRERAPMLALVQRIEAAGYHFNTPLAPHPSSAYLCGCEGLSLELISISQEFDQHAGFVPRTVLLRP